MSHPDRIDFTRLDDSRVIVIKLRRDAANRRDIPTETTIHTDLNLKAALDWCRSNGYTVRVWHGGARAWKGAPWIIRTRTEIWRRRQQVEAEVERWVKDHPGQATPGLTFRDFAYDM